MPQPESTELTLEDSIQPHVQPDLLGEEPEEKQEQLEAPEPVQPVEPVEPVEATAAKKSSMRKSVAPKVNLKDLNLPKDVTKEFDVDGDGEVDVAELIAHVQKHKNLQKSHNFLTKVLLLTLVVMILFLVLCLGASVLAIQLTKEMTVSGGALTATGTCGDGQEICEKPVATGPSKKESRSLTSTMPERAFEELKSLTLKLPHQNGEMVSVTLDVNGFERRMVPTSRCGSVVDLETVHGSLMLDDSQLLASEEFILKMNAKGYNIDDDQALNTVDGGRRLSVGSDIAGMFNFIDQYDYKCESQPKPLRMLDPPFAFTIDLYQMCERTACYSGLDVLKENASSKVKLPGWSRDPHMSDTFVKGMFIKSREEVYSIGPDKVITIQEFPNFPMMSLTSLHNFVDQTFFQKQVFNETHATYCSTRASTEDENAFANLADFIISAVGTTFYKSDPGMIFNRYLLYHKDHPKNTDAYVEFWEEKESGMPHKYFLPNIEDSPRAYFTSVRNLTQEEFDALELRLMQLDCHGPQVQGLTVPVMDEDEITPGDENVTVVEFYRALDDICLQTGCKVSFGAESYWDTILSLDSLIVNSSGSDDAAVESTEGPDSDDPSSIVNSSDRRLSSSKPQPCLKECQGLYNAGWEYKRKDHASKNFGWLPTMGVEFEYDVGEWTSRLGRFLHTSVKGSARGGIAVGAPPLVVIFAAGGEAEGEVVVNAANGQLFGDYKGQIFMSVEGKLEMIVASITVGLSGTVYIGKSFAASHYPAVDVGGFIEGYIDIEVLGGLFNAKAWAVLAVGLTNLGPSLDDPVEKSDDKFEIRGAVGFSVKIFWIFQVRWRTEVTIVKKQDLWTQPAVGVDPASVGKGCYKVSDHERECNGLIVQFSNFVKLNEDFHYSAPENRGSAGSNRFDKSKAYEIFRLPVAQHRDSSPTAVTWFCSDNRRRQWREWGFRRRDGRRRYTEHARGNRFVVFSPDDKPSDLKMVVYNCEY